MLLLAYIEIHYQRSTHGVGFRAERKTPSLPMPLKLWQGLYSLETVKQTAWYQHGTATCVTFTP